MYLSHEMTFSFVFKVVIRKDVSRGHWHNNRANCNKSIKFGSDVPYIKTIKKIREAIKAQLCIGAKKLQKSPSGRSSFGKKVSKYIQIIYQSIAIFFCTFRKI